MKSKSRQAEILEYLKKHKYQHESNALKEMVAKGSEQYVLRENEKAALVQEIIEIVENTHKFESGRISVNEARKFMGLPPFGCEGTE